MPTPIENNTIALNDLLALAESLPERGGGGGVAEKDINFYDYDGTCVEAWTLDELQSKTALPPNPTHEGLTAQGWNWTLAQLKTENAKMNVGQMYITSDGKTRIHIHLEDGRLNPYFGICPNGTVDIDWGDGTTHGTLTGTSTTTAKFLQHTYASGGDYVITLTVTGSMGVSIDDYQAYATILLRYSPSATEYDIRNFVYANCIREVYLGSGVTGITYEAFRHCTSLASITIPSGVTSIGNYVFYDCSSLASITIPSGVTSIGRNIFYNCSSLASITIPSGVTSIEISAFGHCTSLAAITIPSGVTSIGNSAFYNCSSLASITIPSDVTSIGDSAFSTCYSLAAITIPSGVTSIGNYAFSQCAFGQIRFTSTTPPAILRYTFEQLPTDCKIYVPSSRLTQYRNATNYPDPSVYTYIGY